jgi:uncharacterized protein YPO0396
MELRFDFADDDTTTGFRLGHFEFYNWGTYDKKIVKLDLKRSNALLTGDIGSGKSTIVDAITTLIVPHNKIVFNKAAGASTKERTLYSYVVGEYKSAQDENFNRSKAIALRDENSFSVILGRFENIGFDESVTLAQFFYISSKQVQKFFVISMGELGIKKDFFDFDDVRELKKRLRGLNHTQVFDTFKDYSKTFTRAMGIKNAQALNLFYQTVSLKSIGNLTEFIRTHMLESNNIDKNIDELCQNFAELNHAHNLILEAKEQIELLSPIKKNYKKHLELTTNYELFMQMRNSLGVYFSSFEYELLKGRLKELNIELSKKQSKQLLVDEVLKTLNSEIVGINLELEKNGAGRLGKLDEDIKHLNTQMQILKKANETYNGMIKSLGYSAVSNEHRFLSMLEELKAEYGDIENKKTKLQNNITINSVSEQRYKKELDELEVEILYLKNNRSNIPQRVSKIRDEMAKSLNLDLAKLPFIGELIEVKDKKWQGAIERVLHSTSLSLLVADEYYVDVSRYVENTNLRGKLVYLKVDTKKTPYFSQSVPNSIVSKLDVKVDSDYFEVLNTILNEKFNIACVESLQEFRRFKKALSINGQFKTNLRRHEKDDRYNIDDKSRWTLGWDNLSKLHEFTQKAKNTKEKYEFVLQNLQQSKEELGSIESKRDNLRDLLKYDSFSQIDWYRHSKQIDTLQNEKEELQKSNDIIKTLQNKLQEVVVEQENKRKESNNISQEIGTIKQKIEDSTLKYNNTKLLLENGELKDEIRQHLDQLKDETIKHKLTLVNISSSQRAMREHMQKLIDKTNEQSKNISAKIISSQNRYISAFPVIAKELFVSVDSSGEFVKKLDELQKDNLPKWQKRFKELLKEKTIQHIVMLQNLFEKSTTYIKEKISTINLSLADIEYSDGTFIELVATLSTNKEIKEFKQTLKQITTGSIDENNTYDEQKFLQIKTLIERFNGREGHVDVDKKWRNLVSDVRNWFDFSASEKYMSDGSQKEYYAHSGGKSGGQKEKLAYTVLASSLAYQFGLEYDKVQSRSFRFVMIDEAFGRGSDESSKYALRLFEKLKLQLLVITPKQKINVIEPFVKSVHFVHNQDGMDSSLLSLSIEQYQKNKVS